MTPVGCNGPWCIVKTSPSSHCTQTETYVDVYVGVSCLCAQPWHREVLVEAESRTDASLFIWDSNGTTLNEIFLEFWVLLDLRMTFWFLIFFFPVEIDWPGLHRFTRWPGQDIGRRWEPQICWFRRLKPTPTRPGALGIYVRCVSSSTFFFTFKPLLYAFEFNLLHSFGALFVGRAGVVVQQPRPAQQCYILLGCKKDVP